MKKIFTITFFICIGCFVSSINAQCNMDNNYFQAGEVTEYDLYVKWGILNSKGGNAAMRVQNTTYQGKDAYKMTLTSSSQGAARKIFSLDDTLTCFVSKDIVPLAYWKDAHEGGDYTKERVTYSYPGNGKVNVRTVRHKNGTLRFDENISFNNCAYDLMSIVFYARTLDFIDLKQGRTKKVDFVSGKKKNSMQIVYGGTERIKANDGNKYECLKLTLRLSDSAFEDEKDAMTVYITNDDNRMIVRMDSKLKVGSTRVILRSYKGNKYPIGTKR